MHLEKEHNALNKVFQGLDVACRSGAFGLLEAKAYADNIQVLGNMIESGQQAQSRAEELIEQTNFTEDTIEVSGTKDRVARKAQ